VAAGSLAAGGCLPVTDSAELYDPSTDIWSYTGSMTIARYFGLLDSAALPDGSVLVVSGTTCCPYQWFNEAETHDPISQTWTPTSMEMTRANEAPTLLPDGRVLVAGGITGTQPTNVNVADAELFDSSTGTWTATASMSTDRSNHTLTLLNSGQVLVACGYSGGWGICNDLTSAQLYDPNTGAWSPTGSMIGAHSLDSRAILLLNGQVLAMGCRDCEGNVLSSAELYTPASIPTPTPTSTPTASPSPTAAQTSWIELAPSGGPPGAREVFVAVYDPATNRMTIHGGGDLSGALNDAWVLTNADGTEATSPTWTELLPANPLRRSVHAAVYDSLSNRMIVFGGELANGGPYFNDVWVLTNANGNGGVPEWLQLTPSGNLPDARVASTAVYDAVNNRMTIFGGASAQGNLGDVWVLTNANGTEPDPPSWIQLFPTGTPIPPRSQPTAVYDANSNRMTVFGGGDDVSLFNDVWVLTDANGLGGNSEWVELAPDGIPPAPRYSQAAVYDPTTNRMVVFGGSNNSVTFNDTWVLTNANGAGADTPAWVHLAPVGTLPTSRGQLGATYSVSTNRLTIFAGDNAPVCCN